MSNICMYFQLRLHVSAILTFSVKREVVTTYDTPDFFNILLYLISWPAGFLNQ